MRVSHESGSTAKTSRSQSLVSHRPCCQLLAVKNSKTMSKTFDALLHYLDASIIAWSNLRLGFLVPVFGHVAYLVWISWQLGEKKKHPLLLCFPAAGSSSSCQEHSARIVTGNQAWACSCMPENECLNLNASTCFAACNTPLRETDTPPPPPPPPPQPLPEPSAQPSAAKATPIANKTPGNLKFLSPRESF